MIVEEVLACMVYEVTQLKILPFVHTYIKKNTSKKYR